MAQQHSESGAVAVLVSGGLDSAILMAETARTHPLAHPLYVRCGLAWEDVELGHLKRFLDAIRSSQLGPLQLLALPVADLYGDHWSVTGRAVPDADSADEAVYLPGRHVLLLAKAMLWCRLHGVATVALATLAANPFPDATPEFFRAFQDAVNLGVQGMIEIKRPYAGLSKSEVMGRGRGLPLELTFSCIRPVGDLHCGQCNKCAERRRAFQACGLTDGTQYAEIDEPRTKQAE